MSVEALLKAIAAEAPRVTVAEARQVYKTNPDRFILPERVRARHIVIHREQRSASEAVATLLNLRSKLLVGAITWDEAVASTSSCPNNSDLGFFQRGMMFESFEAAAFAAEEDAITDVVATPMGWHLIHVIAHAPEEQALFDEVREQLMADLQTERDREAIERYVDERKAQ
jgi:peptidyl-prolyl cis-trans isomerase C